MPGPYVSTTPTTESPEAKAIRLLTRQLKELGDHICFLNDDQHHDFKAWRDTTRGYLERFLGKDNHHSTRFRDTRFHGPSYLRSDFPGVSQGPSRREIEERVEAFQKGCATASATLLAAIKHVDDFGVYEEPAEAAPKRKAEVGSGGIHFSAPMNIQNFAIAGRDQTIGHIGNKTGIDLKEIADLLKQSLDITPRQLNDAVKGLEVLGAEEQKPPEKKDWKSILTYGQLVLGVMGKAADLGHKLVPYTAHIMALVEAAKHALK